MLNVSKSRLVQSLLPTEIHFEPTSDPHAIYAVTGPGQTWEHWTIVATLMWHPGEAPRVDLQGVQIVRMDLLAALLERLQLEVRRRA